MLIPFKKLPGGGYRPAGVNNHSWSRSGSAPFRLRFSGVYSSRGPPTQLGKSLQTLVDMGSSFLYCSAHLKGGRGPFSPLIVVLDALYYQSRMNCKPSRMIVHATQGHIPRAMERKSLTLERKGPYC
jgi:hypothetical protein